MPTVRCVSHEMPTIGERRYMGNISRTGGGKMNSINVEKRHGCVDAQRHVQGVDGCLCGSLHRCKGRRRSDRGNAYARLAHIGVRLNHSEETLVPLPRPSPTVASRRAFCRTAETQGRKRRHIIRGPALVLATTNPGNCLVSSWLARYWHSKYPVQFSFTSSCLLVGVLVRDPSVHARPHSTSDCPSLIHHAFGCISGFIRLGILSRVRGQLAAVTSHVCDPVWIGI